MKPQMRDFILWITICISALLTIALGYELACNGLSHRPAVLLDAFGIVAAGLTAQQVSRSL
ncbi:hypothetical protein GCM10008957_47350 [Deinococcus ruber]|uniref:Uncharacterized protein n=2 Tax=Deinococcus ruber TaxID=1848197 RepID=A0A918CP07_9DEIO|nr:hypothetical protein GCM10008957_47350 [Deinococcus ruber]